MPASSIDTFFACSLMVILIVSAMVSTAKLVQPYLSTLANTNGVDRCRGLADYILLNPGNPSDWGRIGNSAPSAFGLASDAVKPYALDLDKVSRLNSQNTYAITYQQILAALGTSDTSFNIQLRTIFQVFIDPVSSQNLGNETIHTFHVSTTKSGFPISTWLNCYVILASYVDNVISSTDSDGVGTINVTLPNSLSGTTLLTVLARAQAYPQMMAFNAYSFGHNSETLSPNGTFLRLSPLNHVLNVSFQEPALEIADAYVFTYGYSFSLSPTALGNQSIEYSVPLLSEASPMILVVNGYNGSASFAEWTVYPQLPLEIGANLDDLNTRLEAEALTYIVSVNHVLYEAVITLRSVPNVDA